MLTGSLTTLAVPLTLGADTRLTTLSTGFTVPVLRVLDGGQIYAGQLTSTVFSNMDFVVDSGVARMGAYYGNAIHVNGRLKGGGQIALGQKGNVASPGADYSFRGDNSEWAGTMVVTQRVEVAAANAFTDAKYYQRLQLGAASDIGGRLGEFRSDALVLSKYAQLLASALLFCSRRLGFRCRPCCP